MSNRKAATAATDISTKSRYFKKLEQDIKFGNEYQKKRASKNVKEQILLWELDQSSPYDDPITNDEKYYSANWADSYHGTINLELWDELSQ